MPEICPTPAFRVTGDPVLHGLKGIVSHYSITFPFHCAHAISRLALLKVRSVSLSELATGFGGQAKVESHDQRRQRFFRSFELDQDALARLLVGLVPVGDGPWQLTMDRTN